MAERPLAELESEHAATGRGSAVPFLGDKMRALVLVALAACAACGEPDSHPAYVAEVEAWHRERLASLARHRFRQLKIRNVRVKHTDGGMGMPEYAPFDAIIVTAAPEGVPRALVAQLKVGGAMILPIGPRDEQVLVRVVRTDENYDTEFLERVAFVPLIGGVL